MQPGKLRFKVQLKEHTETNTDGEVTRTWATRANVWAEIRTPTGREVEQQGHIIPNLSKVITIRWRDDINPTWRVYYKSEIYDIGSISPDNRNKEYLVLRCNQKVSV